VPRREVVAGRSSFLPYHHCIAKLQSPLTYGLGGRRGCRTVAGACRVLFAATSPMAAGVRMAEE